MSEWREIALGDLLTFGNGKRKPSTDGNIPIYGGNGILGFSNDSNYQGETIIIGRVGAYCGSVYYETKPIWISDNALSAKPKGNHNLKFLYYFLKQVELNQYAGGSSHPLVTQTLLNSLEFDVCTNSDEQKAIAEVLSALDDKIDLLHRQNKTLEQMAETLFRQWFVEEAGEDLEETTLGEVIETTSGGTPSRKNIKFYENGVYSWVKSKELTGSFILETEEHISDAALEKSSAKLLPKHSVLIAMYGATVGEYSIISDQMTCNQAICALKPNSNYPYTFLFMFVKVMKEEIINMAVGSAQQNISQILIKSLPVASPNEKINEFHIKTKNSFKKIENNIKQIHTLESLRDTLLPKLMSGEVRIASHG